LRQFLDGLEDEDASFHVEFITDPKDVNEAVSEVARYLETKQRPVEEARFKKNRKAARAVKEESPFIMGQFQMTGPQDAPAQHPQQTPQGRPNLKTGGT
jgi:hypothetical protein